GPNFRRKPQPVTADGLMTAAQAATLKRLAQDAYELDAFKPNLTGTEDSGRALAYMKRFGSVTVLNGHIHQVMQKVEGNVTFHTARSTAFPQPAPGTAPSPGPMKVPEEKIRTLLGTASVTFKPGEQRLAIIDTPLQS
ncbi:MAG: hypothetical protein WA679_24550, partial [Pseudolabrys sp.]